jgi:hypothetical protein
MGELKSSSAGWSFGDVVDANFALDAWNAAKANAAK